METLNKNFPEEEVANYYKFVDARDFDSLCELFSDDIVYKRCEEIISGIKNLKLFYTQERKIEGKHSLSNVWSRDNEVMVRGVFIGNNGDGQAIELCFADFFELNQDNKICKRETYLANGFENTK